jgi:thymidylate synthase
MVQHFLGETCDEVWRQAACALTTEPGAAAAASRLGPSREYLNCVFEVEDPRQRWVLSRSPSMNPAFAIAELVWILSGSDSARAINFWNPRLPVYSGQEDRYHGAYGHRLRVHFGVDQISRALDALSGNPLSRQVVLQIWDVNSDFPMNDGTPRSPDIPCNIVSLLKVRDGRLHWTQVLRSNDLYLGTPHNFVQFTSLQEIVAGCLGIELGPYVQLSHSLHVYESDVTRFGVTARPVAGRNMDDLGVVREEFVRVVAVMTEAMAALSSPDLVPRVLGLTIARAEIPASWRNLLCVLAADAARRRGWPQEIASSMHACTNSVLKLAWAGWHSRVARAGT